MIAACASPVWCADGYDPVFLGTLGGRESWALGVNAKGAIVGCSTDAQGRQRPFIWTVDKKMEALETLGGENGAAVSINDDGEIAGYSNTADGATHAFLKTLEGTLADLDVLPGDKTSHGTFVREVLVGWSSSDAGEIHAFTWTVDSSIIPLASPTPGEQTQAFGVNKTGTAVGAAKDSSGVWRAVTWRPDGTVSMQDTGSVGGAGSVAYAINDAGLVVGEATDELKQVRAFCWVPPYGVQQLGLPRDMDMTASRATCINNSNKIAGYVQGKTRKAVVWDLGPDLSDNIKVTLTVLPLLPGTVESEATAISDDGSVVGFCTTRDGQKRAVVWRLQKKRVFASFALVAGMFAPTNSATRDKFSSTWFRVGLKPFQRERPTYPRFSAETGAFRFDGPTDVQLYEMSFGIEKGLSPRALIQPYLALRGGPYWAKMTDSIAGTEDSKVGLNLNASYGVIYNRNVYAELRYDYFSRFAGVDLSGLSLSVGFRVFDLRR